MNVVTSRENGSYIPYTNGNSSNYLSNSSSSSSSFDSEANMTTNHYYYAAMSQTNISPVSSSSMRSSSPPASPSSLSSLSFASSSSPSSSSSSSSILNTTQPISYSNTSKIVATGYNCQTYQLNSNERYHEHQNSHYHTDNYCQLPQVSSYSQYSISDHNQTAITNGVSSTQIQNNNKGNLAYSMSTDMETNLSLPKFAADDSKPPETMPKNFRIK